MDSLAATPGGEVTKPIPVALCIDIEPDPREPERDPAEPWAGFEKLMHSVERIRGSFEAVTSRPAHFTWFLRMDPQVAEIWGTAALAAETYTRELAELVGAGDELGVHPHSWRWDSSTGHWISDQGDEHWVAHCAHMALDAYEETFGRPCAAYRHGDRAMTTHLACTIADAGVQVDLTVEPGLLGTPKLNPDERATGWIMSTVTAPAHPYWPSRGDFRIPDPVRSEGLLMIPLTRGLDIETDDTHARPRGRWETLVLWDDPQRFRSRLLQRLGDPSLTHLAFAIRTDMPLRTEWSWVEANIAELCRHPIAGELRFCAASEASSELVPMTHGPSDPVRTDAPGFARADLWRHGSDDPGFIERAECQALKILNDTHARLQHDAELSGERIRGLTQQLSEAERGLA